MKHLSERESDDSGHNVMPNSELEKVETLFAQLGLMTWQSFVKNRLPLLNLPEDVLETIRKGQIAYTKAKEIARIKVVQTRKKILKRAIAEEWSLNQIKDHLKTLQTKSEQPSQSPLKQQFDAVYQKAKRVKIWENPDSQKRLQELLTEIETLLAKAEA
ncbi:hypothetical protein IQ250_16660 [Pseudanabaenaceae cyanobacterium LEGE 13415]|nr:hypothetical protein [Pseudanabaenaceae cyanobacterium LEGE 13415]